YGTSRVIKKSAKPNGSMATRLATKLDLITAAVAPIAENTSTGPTISTDRYCPKRCDSPRGCWMRQMKLKLSSTFWMSEITVNRRKPTPTDPSTPTLMLSTKPMTLCEISTDCGPSGSSRRSSKGSSMLWTPSALSTENASASSGTTDSSD